MTPTLNTKTRRVLRNTVGKDDSSDLFNYAWRKIRWFAGHSEIDDLDGLYETIVSEAVNNPRSRFYIYG